VKKIVGLTVAVLLAGCGGSEEFVFQSPQTNPPVLSATISNPAGQAAPGVLVVAQERTTGRQYERLSGADGTVALSLPAGVYDIALDREGDATTSTCFYGPVTVSGPTQRVFVLQSAAGLPATRVFGVLSRTATARLANQPIVLRPGACLGDVTGIDWAAPLTATTDQEGAFSLDLPSEDSYALDLEILQNNVVDEFVDVFKREKPCYLELFTEESEVENLLRCNQSDLGPELNGQSVLAQGVVVVDKPFDSCVIDTATNQMVMEGAILPPGADREAPYLSDLVPSVPSDSNYDNLIGLMTTRGPVGDDGCKILVDSDHAWYWGKYAVHVNPDRPSSFTFVDQTGAQYHLGIDNADNVWHKVSYNSSRPPIQSLRYSVD
jgi:hypothetical protein